MSYSPKSVDEAWANHFAAFGGQDVAKIMLDYTEESKITTFNHATQTKEIHTGTTEIEAFFTGLFKAMPDLSELAAPEIICETEPFKQTYLCWSCPSSGIVSAHNTFFYNDSYKIIRQNIAFTTKA